MQRVAGLERFVQNMVWLPTWQEARGIFRALGVSHKDSASNVIHALEEGRELTCLYELIFEALLDAANGDAILKTAVAEKVIGHDDLARCR